MNKIFFSILIFASLMAGCTRHFEPAKITNTDFEYEIIKTDKEKMLSIAYNGIKKRLPYTTILPLASEENEIGYSFYTLAALDRTDYKLKINKVEGESDGTRTIGYVYHIDSHGTQWLIGSVYIEPIMDNISQSIIDSKIEVIPAKSIKYLDNSK